MRQTRLSAKSLTPLLLTASLFFGCSPEDQQADALDSETRRIQTILTASCMPCHSRTALPQVIERTKQASFPSVDGESRERILAELEELQLYIDEGLPISFAEDETELHKFFKSTPGEFYMMLEKGIMPPPWAPDLMKQINWPDYKHLTTEERIELLKYSKPYSEKYLR